MSNKGFIKIPIDKFDAIPSYIFGDERLSIGAKGLYVQMYLYNSCILSVEELLDFTTTKKEDIDNYIHELLSFGYLSFDDKDNWSLNIIPIIIKTTNMKKVDTKIKNSENKIEQLNKSINSINERKNKKITTFNELLTKNGISTTFDDIKDKDDWDISFTTLKIYERLKNLYNDINLLDSKIEELTNQLNEANIISKSWIDEKTRLTEERKELVKEKVQDFIETEKPKPLSIYDKIVGLITQKYDFSDNVDQMLITYFEKRLSKKGRFADAEDLHSGTVRAMLAELLSFHMSDEDMITCIQTSIDKEWFKFVDHRLSSTTTFKPFDKSTITSGSYTEEDIRQIKERAAALEAEGKKGTF